jgi:hypothetical protein
MLPRKIQWALEEADGFKAVVVETTLIGVRVTKRSYDIDEPGDVEEHSISLLPDEAQWLAQYLLEAAAELDKAKAARDASQARKKA